MTWSTEEVERWIDNDESLYRQIGDAELDPDEITKILREFNIPGVDLDNVDVDQIAADNGYREPDYGDQPWTDAMWAKTAPGRHQ